MAQSHDTHDATSPSSKRTSLRSRILLFPQPPTTQSSHASQTSPPDRPGAARTLDEELIFSLIPSRCTAPAEYARLRVFALAPPPNSETQSPSDGEPGGGGYVGPIPLPLSAGFPDINMILSVSLFSSWPT